MGTSAADVSTTVEYSVDKWRMDRLPWALWFAVGGLAICLNTDSHGGTGAALAFLYIALLGLAFAGWAATALIERSGYPVYVILPAVILLACLIGGFISLFGTPIRHSVTGQPWWFRLVSPPLDVFGWMMIYLSVGWIAFVLVRHAYPPRPLIRLSPAGLAFHRPWLPDLFIPWHNVEGVGPLETEDGRGGRNLHPRATAIVLSRAFYEQEIRPRRSFLSPPGAERMFIPKGQSMQMVLANPELVVAPEDLRAPIAARWQAFRDRARAAQASASQRETPIVYGRGSIGGTWWRWLMLAAPLVAGVAVVLHASGLWPG